MPTFDNTYYISFHADAKETDRDKVTRRAYPSYLTEGSSVEQREEWLQDYFDDTEASISFNLNKPRNLIGKTQVKICRINYAFLDKDRYFVNERLNIARDIGYTNYTIGVGTLAKFLEKVTPYSIIYIDAHGCKSNYSLYQTIWLKENNAIVKKSTKIPVWFLAKILATYIPKGAQNNLKIHLMLCEGFNIAPTLMLKLHTYGFKKTSVVGYIGAVISSDNADGILDFSTEDREIPSLGGRKFHHGTDARRVFGDNKLVSHNYSGSVMTEEYHKFKQRVLTPSLNKHERDQALFEDCLILIDKLEEYINFYLQRFNPEDSPRPRYCRHGQSGIDRALHFLTFLKSHREDVMQNLISMNHSFIEDEHKLLLEIKLFCSKGQGYANYSGNINVNEHSCLTYIEKGINNFYWENHESIESNLLCQFGNYLARNSSSRTVPNSIFRDMNNITLAERKEIKSRLLNVNLASMIIGKPKTIS